MHSISWESDENRLPGAVRHGNILIAKVWTPEDPREGGGGCGGIDTIIGNVDEEVADDEIKEGEFERNDSIVIACDQN
ncbi:hypothetical protein QR98_0094440 [Sarcoptes scabiei]|nr:hypothetical protein QR98_0094440 [Sarcoptes scabiei]